MQSSWNICYETSLPADGVGSEEKQNLKERSYFPSREKTVAGQNLGLLGPEKPNEKICRQFGGNREVAFILSWQRGERSQLVPPALCPPLSQEESRGYIRQGLAGVGDEE